MTFYVEMEAELSQTAAEKLTNGVNEANENIFDINGLTELLLSTVMDSENCPYEVSVNIVVTDNEGIREINRDFRQIDMPTDVLSFPVFNFMKAADFSGIGENESCFDPDSGEFLLGDIIISAEKLRGQAAVYGHSLKREYAFLLTHSLLHLLGYNHLAAGEAEIMEQKQEDILNQAGIKREKKY